MHLANKMRLEKVLTIDAKKKKLVKLREKMQANNIQIRSKPKMVLHGK